MNKYEKSFINILPASINSIFCYFNFSSSCMKEFEQIYEDHSWDTSKTMLKLYYIENGIAIEKQSVFTDGLADNWYITLEENDVDLFVEIGKLLINNEYIPLISSNILYMPRNNQINATNIYMIDINNPNSSSNFDDSESNNNYIYNTEILKSDMQSKNQKKLEEYISKKHCDLSSSK
jgi:hypothetical protein